MASLLTHPAVPLALALALGRERVPPRLLLAGIAASMLPDADVIGFRWGVAYGDALGHRGATHSLAFALALGALAAALAARLRSRAGQAFAFVAASAASHGLLDMLTNGGLGVALWWPLSSERLFFPDTPIEVSPIGLRRFLGPAGAAVLASELRWVWLPALALGGLGWVWRHGATMRSR